VPSRASLFSVVAERGDRDREEHDGEQFHQREAALLAQDDCAMPSDVVPDRSRSSVTRARNRPPAVGGLTRMRRRIFGGTIWRRCSIFSRRWFVARPAARRSRRTCCGPPATAVRAARNRCITSSRRGSSATRAPGGAACRRAFRRHAGGASDATAEAPALPTAGRSGTTPATPRLRHRHSVPPGVLAIRAGGADAEAAQTADWAASAAASLCAAWRARRYSSTTIAVSSSTEVSAVGLSSEITPSTIMLTRSQLSSTCT
jgi:hypothetical protein